MTNRLSTLTRGSITKSGRDCKVSSCNVSRDLDKRFHGTPFLNGDTNGLPVNRDLTMKGYRGGLPRDLLGITTYRLRLENRIKRFSQGVTVGPLSNEDCIEIVVVSKGVLGTIKVTTLALGYNGARTLAINGGVC